MLHGASQFNISTFDNENQLTELSYRLDDMKGSMPDLNEQVLVTKPLEWLENEFMEMTTLVHIPKLLLLLFFNISSNQ